MKHIRFTNPHRKKHFDFFNKMDQPHFGICANIDISNLLACIKKRQLAFTPTMVYLIAHTANLIPQFRYRIRNQQIVEHEAVHPSFAVKVEATDVFSFCEVKYQANYTTFAKNARDRMAEMHQNPSFEDEIGRDDYLFLSAFPWASFTSVQHAMHYSPVDSVPRIVWGKYFEDKETIKMPLSVQAHHALVDGVHMGRYFELFQELCSSIEQWIELP